MPKPHSKKPAKRKPTPATKRTVDDPRVALILAAVDRGEQSDRAHADDPDNGCQRSMASKIVDRWANCPERFHDERGWEPEAIRAFVLAYALNCPDNVLEEACCEARECIEWCEWWDAEGYDEANRPPAKPDLDDTDRRWLAAGRALRSHVPDLYATMLALMQRSAEDPPTATVQP
jgi:hypothetical protein